MKKVIAMALVAVMLASSAQAGQMSPNSSSAQEAALEKIAVGSSADANAKSIQQGDQNGTAPKEEGPGIGMKIVGAVVAPVYIAGAVVAAIVVAPVWLAKKIIGSE